MQTALVPTASTDKRIAAENVSIVKDYGNLREEIRENGTDNDQKVLLGIKSKSNPSGSLESIMKWRT